MKKVVHELGQERTVRWKCGKTAPASNGAIHQLSLATRIQCGKNKYCRGSLSHKEVDVTGVRTPNPSPPDCPRGRWCPDGKGAFAKRDPTFLVGLNRRVEPNIRSTSLRLTSRRPRKISLGQWCPRYPDRQESTKGRHKKREREERDLEPSHDVSSNGLSWVEE